MNILERVRQFEEADKPIDALEAYDEIFNQGIAEWEDYINAAVLLFLCQDYGYSSEHRLPKSIIDQAWYRSNEILDEAEKNFGPIDEITFWRRYFEFAVLGEPSFEDECKYLVNKGMTLVPCLHILSSTSDIKYLPHCRKLLNRVNDGKTAKDRYVKSILENIPGL